MVEMHEPRKCLFGDRDSVALKEERVEERQRLVAPLRGELAGMADRRSGRGVVLSRLVIWPLKLVRLIWSSQQSSSHESLSACHLRRRCDLRGLRFVLRAAACVRVGVFYESHCERPRAMRR